VSKIDEEADTLTYRQTINYTFVPELSKDAAGNQLSLEDVVAVVNLPFIVRFPHVHSTRLTKIHTHTPRNRRYR